MKRKQTPITDEEFERQYSAAAKAEEEAAATEPRAKKARYDRRSGRIIIELTNGCTFAFPSELGQGLAGATPEQLAAVEVTPSGYGLHWEELDADLAVPSLVAGIFGSKRWMSELGRRGGQVKSDRKAAAARTNGGKGGRPRKAASP